MEKEFIAYPLKDEYMTYDYASHRYVLTAKYITDVVGINLEYRIASNRGINATAVINAALNSISRQVYGYIFKHNDSRVLTWLIAKSPSARDIIREAMGEQARYVFTVGDLTKVADRDKQELAVDVSARGILDNSELAETGTTLTYCGHYNICVPDYKSGGY